MTDFVCPCGFWENNCPHHKGGGVPTLDIDPTDDLLQLYYQAGYEHALRQVHDRIDDCPPHRPPPTKPWEEWVAERRALFDAYAEAHPYVLEDWPDVRTRRPPGSQA